MANPSRVAVCRRGDVNRPSIWAPLVAAPGGLFAIWSAGLPSWGRMWGLAIGIFFVCKWATWIACRSRECRRWRQLAYFFLWPGLDADAFCARPSRRNMRRPSAAEWTSGTVSVVAGAALIGTAGIAGGAPELARGVLAMIGILFVLHFGTFRLLSCAWRAAAVDAKPVMNAPLSATSVAEFWGRRWNTAFRDFAHRLIFRPLSVHIGPESAFAACFFVSGLLHDVVISLPAGAGYGGPTLYFVFQAAAIAAERTRAFRSLGIIGGTLGRAWTLLIVAAPLPLLFHPPFLRNVMLPFAAALCGAIGWHA
jgi:hypothetical protein